MEPIGLTLPAPKNSPPEEEHYRPPKKRLRLSESKIEALKTNTFYKVNLGAEQHSPEIAIKTTWNTQLAKRISELTEKEPSDINIISFCNAHEYMLTGSNDVKTDPLYPLHKIWAFLKNTDQSLSPEKRTAIFSEWLEGFLVDALGSGDKGIREKIVHDALEFLQSSQLDKRLITFPAWYRLHNMSKQWPSQINLFSFIDLNISKAEGGPNYPFVDIFSIVQNLPQTLHPDELEHELIQRLGAFHKKSLYAREFATQLKEVQDKIIDDAIEFLQKKNPSLPEGETESKPPSAEQFFSFTVTERPGAPSAITELKKVVQELPGTNIHFDESTKTLQFGYQSNVIRVLARKSPTLKKLIGSGYYTIFEGYSSKATPLIKPHFYIDREHFLLANLTRRFFRHVNLTTKNPLSLPAAPCSETQLLSACLENSPGICIGERHAESSPKEFLCQHFPYLVAHGVTTLFLEHLPSESLQKEIDQFLASPKDTPMPLALSLYLDDQDSRLSDPSKYGFKDVIVAAKSAGIKHIICLDTDETYTMGSDARDGVTNAHERIAAMNCNAVKVINANKDKGKYVLFVGATHIEQYDDIPGLSQLTGCPSIFIQDEKIEKNIGISQNESLKEEDHTFHFDVVVRKFPSQKM